MYLLKESFITSVMVCVFGGWFQHQEENIKTYPPKVDNTSVMGSGQQNVIYGCLKGVETRGAVALRYFLSRRHRIDRLNIQQLILKKKPIFEKKKLSMEILMEDFKPI